MVYIGLQCIKTIIIYFVACQYQRDNLVTFSTSTRLTRVAQFLCNSCVSFLFLSGAYVTMLNFYFMHSFGLYCLQWRHHAAGSEFPMVIHHESYSNTVTHGVHADVNPGNVLRRLPATGGGGKIWVLKTKLAITPFSGNGWITISPGISRVLEHIATKFQRLYLSFWGQAF